MILSVTLIKTTQITHNTNDSQYPDKHASTKVFLCKDPESFASKVKPRLHQFSVKRKGHKQRTATTSITLQTCNKEYSLNEGWSQYKSKESKILHKNQWEGTVESI